jgi:MraZ protein
MSIPSAYRTELERHSDGPPMVTSSFACLYLYPYEDWRVVERRIVEHETENLDYQDYQRMMISGAAECPIDKQGRVLIPQHLRDHAGLDREVTIAGVGPRIEIWDKARFDARLEQTQANFPEISSRVADLMRSKES